MFNVLLSIISTLNGHIRASSTDTRLFAPPTSSKLDHIFAVFALSTVGHLAGLAHATPTPLWSRIGLPIDLVKKEVLKYVPD